MQDPREVVDKIRKEENDLSAKLLNLEYFMMTEDYQRISDRQKLLLKQQHEAMSTYKRILIARAIQINFEEKDKEEPKTDSTDPNDHKHGCANCKHSEFVPGDNYSKPRCTNPKADGKTCWEPIGPKIREYR